MKVVCFDLDDTLNKELNYLKSAYREIVRFAVSHYPQVNDSIELLADKAYQEMLAAYEVGNNAFERLNSFLQLSIPIQDYLQIYRNHLPNIALTDETKLVLEQLKAQGVKLGLITDGRSVQQRNKINVLGLEQYFDEDLIIISEEFGSEKPSSRNYCYFMDKFPTCNDFTYVGDNLKKDFIAPNALGWMTICLKDDGTNIHKQVFEGLDGERSPKGVINSISELMEIL